MEDGDQLIERRCRLCRGFGVAKDLAVYLRWERQLENVAADFLETRRVKKIRCWQIMILNAQARGKRCFHCNGRGVRRKVIRKNGDSA